MEDAVLSASAAPRPPPGPSTTDRRGVANIPKPRPPPLPPPSPPPLPPSAPPVAPAPVGATHGGGDGGAQAGVHSRHSVSGGGTEELHVYDFDGTLVNTPVPEVGMAQFEEATGVPWRGVVEAKYTL